MLKDEVEMDPIAAIIIVPIVLIMKFPIAAAFIIGCIIWIWTVKRLGRWM